MSEEARNETPHSPAENIATASGQPDQLAPSAPGVSGWGEAAGAGAFGGAIAGLIASYGSGKLGLAGFVIFLFVMMGINGGGRKTLAAVVFGLCAAVAVAILKW